MGAQKPSICGWFTRGARTGRASVSAGGNWIFLLLHFELVITLKTARALGLNISRDFLAYEALRRKMAANVDRPSADIAPAISTARGPRASRAHSDNRAT